MLQEHYKKFHKMQKFRTYVNETKYLKLGKLKMFYENVLRLENISEKILQLIKNRSKKEIV